MLKTLLFAIGLALPTGALAQEADILPPNVIFVTSTGYWEESARALSGDRTGVDGNAAGMDTGQRGYYKLVAVRQPDGTAEIHLQQIALGAAGPEVVSSAELDEFTALKAYVTDIRPETSTGVTRQPGMFATVYLKTDPSAAEPESWTVLIDDLGEIKIERATN